MQKISIIGQGFVGSAVREGFRSIFSVTTYDKKEPNAVNVYSCGNEEIAHVQSSAYTWKDLIQNHFNDSVTFLCLPTPMKEDGSCDISILADVIQSIVPYCEEANCNTLVIKSTVPPGTTKAFQEQYPELGFCFNPEFLTEANALEDFKNQDRIILGGCGESLSVVRDLYLYAFFGIPIYRVDSTTAEFVKYFTNVALAVKVSLANELKQIANKLGIDYNVVKELATLDERLGSTHWDVPGPDGKPGFGGSCFPKDLCSLIHEAKSFGVDPKVMMAAWEKNLELRPEQDWKQLKGRAVV